tara:strand:+ start:252 stop:605 length:354 start_codon:yes stop_codon:yes gene_type:complete
MSLRPKKAWATAPPLDASVVQKPAPVSGISLEDVDIIRVVAAQETDKLRAELETRIKGISMEIRAMQTNLAVDIRFRNEELQKIVTHLRAELDQKSLRIDDLERRLRTLEIRKESPY